VDAAAGVVEEVARIVGQIRRHWPNVRIMVRAHSALAREDVDSPATGAQSPGAPRAPASTAMIGSVPQFASDH
jgi:hypothetical protein